MNIDKNGTFNYFFLTFSTIITKWKYFGGTNVAICICLTSRNIILCIVYVAYYILSTGKYMLESKSAIIFAIRVNLLAQHNTRSATVGLKLPCVTVYTLESLLTHFNWELILWLAHKECNIANCEIKNGCNSTYHFACFFSLIGLSTTYVIFLWNIWQHFIMSFLSSFPIKIHTTLKSSYNSRSDRARNLSLKRTKSRITLYSGKQHRMMALSYLYSRKPAW